MRLASIVVTRLALSVPHELMVGPRRWPGAQPLGVQGRGNTSPLPRIEPSMTSQPDVTGTSVAFAGQAAYAQLLNEVLGEEGIQVSQLIIGGRIIAGDAEKDPDMLAGHLWDLHTKRDGFHHQSAPTDQHHLRPRGDNA